MHFFGLSVTHEVAGSSPVVPASVFVDREAKCHTRLGAVLTAPQGADSSLLTRR